MATVTVNDASLSAIADAIREKLDVETTYLPSQMAAAIESIETGGTDLTSADEGKVVVESSGEYVLATQTSRSISQNGTYDTTTNDEVVVSVSGGGGGDSLFFELGDLPPLFEAPSDSVFGPTSSSSHFIRPKTQGGDNVKLDLSLPFEIGCRFKLGDVAGSSGRNAFGSDNSYYHCPTIAAFTDKIAYYVSTTGNSWGYSSVSITPSGYVTPTDTWIFVKLSWDGTDFSFYVDDGSDVYESTLENVTPYYNQNYGFEFAGQNKSTYSVCAVSGSYIDLSKTYLKQGGTIVWGADASKPSGSDPILVSKTITQNGTYDASDDSADGYSSVTVNVSGGLEEWDLTQSSVGLIRGIGLGLSSVTIGSSGAVFDGTNDAIRLPTAWNGMTFEVDVASMNLSDGAHRRFIMSTSQNGLIYRMTGVWAFYYGNWVDSSETDGSFFDGSTVKVHVDENGYWHIYKDGTLWWEPNIRLDVSEMNIGSTNGNSINNAVISGIRIQ